MTHIGIVTVRDADYHPNRRLLEASRAAGHTGYLIHPYRLWPTTTAGSLSVAAESAVELPQVVLPRQGAQIGDACLSLIRQFELMGAALVNGAAALTVARNKFLTQQVLTAAGLPCPDTVLVNAAMGLFQAVERIGGYPVVVKPVSGRQGSGLLRLADADALRRRALPVLNRRHGLLVQRYYPPRRRQDIRALVIGGELVCAAALTPAEGDFRANFHLGGRIRSTDLTDDLHRLAIAAAAAVGCDIAGVDLMVDEFGRPVVVEVNYSPGFKGLEAASGLDIAGRMIRFAVTRPLFPKTTRSG
jgi:ribosomal protein S6--L-glutamate ligase